MFCNRKGTVHSSFSSANRLLQGIRSDEKLELEISALGGAIVLRDDTKIRLCWGLADNFVPAVDLASLSHVLT